LDRLAFGVFSHAERHLVPLRLLQNHLGDIEQRVGSARHLDLARQRFHAPFIRQQTDVDFRQRRRRGPPLALFPAHFRSSRAIAPGAVATVLPGRTPALPAGAVVSAAGWSLAPGRARAAPVVPAFLPLHRAFVFGVLGGRGYLLRPSGQKEFF
jgi:hypothetical protein